MTDTTEPAAPPDEPAAPPTAVAAEPTTTPTPTLAPAPAADLPAPPAPAPDFAPANAGNKAPWVLILAAVIAIALVVIIFVDDARHWFALHTGMLKGGPDVYYNFWSGFGSDLGEATLIGAVAVGVYTGVRKVNCHTKGCWRIGHHPLEGTPYILCRHHHPHVPTAGASHDHILAQHHKFTLEKHARDNR